MSLLRPSTAGKLLRAGAPSALRPIPSSKRFDSRTAVGTPLTISDKSQPSLTTVESPISNELSSDLQVRQNKPDYTAEIDQATSYVNG
jgi:NADH dehydrogenase (ubiquinone) Fe-S protein 4